MPKRSNRSFQGPASLLAGAFLAASGALGCSQGSSPSTGASLEIGSIQNDPGATDGFTKFIVEENKGGNASQVKIAGMVWGRLVDVFDCKDCGLPTETRKPLFRDLLIDASVQSDLTDYELATNPATSRQELTIRHTWGSGAFAAAFAQLEIGLQPVKVKSLATNELPPFTAIPRNAAVAILLDDLVDPATVDSTTVQVDVGYPPTNVFEARVVPDRCHGDLKNGVFYSTRVILDMTVSKEESEQSGGTLQVNALGLPTAINTSQANVGVRIPTQVSANANQLTLLRNLAGKTVAFLGNGPADPTSPTKDVVRAMRSGGRTSVTLDPYEGFLPDDDPPEVLASQLVSVGNIVALGSGRFQLDVTYGTASCALTPRVGDLIELASAVLRVTKAGPPPTGAVVAGIEAKRIDDLSPNAPAFGGGAAEYKAPWDTQLGYTAACFLRVNGIKSPPAAGVAPTATLALSFSEPMNPETMSPFDDFIVTDAAVPTNQPLKRRVVGNVVPNLDLTSFTFIPSLPLKHAASGTELFEVDLISGVDSNSGKPFGARDLAGNPISDLLPQVDLTLDSQAQAYNTGSVSLRFNAVDEDGDGFPEIRGQYVYDLSRGVVQPRGVTRFDAWMDDTNASAPTVQAMVVPAPPGPLVVQEPYSPYGSRLMTVWRYCDLGLPFYEDFFFNLDVEGLYLKLQPGFNLQLDNFPQFQFLISHSKYAPNEYVQPGMMGAPPVLVNPNSGIKTQFDENILDLGGGVKTQTVLAPKDQGYLFQPLDAVLPPGSSGIVMAPLPINLNKPINQYTYWTWRDTGITAVAGPACTGVDTLANPNNGPPNTNYDNAYAEGLVPTIGLPMLLDFRTYPAETVASGVNLLHLTAVNFGTFNLPFFRSHSTGGYKSDNTTLVKIDPDQETNAKGGQTPAGLTPPQDSGFYYGGASFVTRVNRIHTRWFDAGALSSFAPLVAEPSFSQQPGGTQVSFAFRGATLITPATSSVRGDLLDPYGNSKPSIVPPVGVAGFTVNYTNGDASWKPLLANLDGSRYVQVRVTMVSNAETGVTPELSSLGISYFQ